MNRRLKEVAVTDVFTDILIIDAEDVKRTSKTGMKAALGITNVASNIRVLAQSAVPVSVGATTGEVTLATCMVMQGSMGPNGAIRVTAQWTNTNSSITKTMKTYFGGSVVQSEISTSTISKLTTAFIHNRNSETSQIGGFGTGGTGGLFYALSIDTAGDDQPITITGTSGVETGFTPTQANMSGTGTVVTVVQTTHGLVTGDTIRASGSSTAGYNADPVVVTRLDTNTFTYPAAGTGTPTTSPLIRRYSALTLEAYTIELLPGV